MKTTSFFIMLRQVGSHKLYRSPDQPDQSEVKKLTTSFIFPLTLTELFWPLQLLCHNGTQVSDSIESESVDCPQVNAAVQPRQGPECADEAKGKWPAAEEGWPQQCWHRKVGQEGR